jgi:hypothetical protein
MAKMIKDTVKAVCGTCGANYVFARVIKPWADPATEGDAPFKGMVRRCKCGSFDSQGKDVKKLVG